MSREQAPQQADPQAAKIAEARGDLRLAIELARESGRLEVIEDADPELEIGAIYELSAELEDAPVLLFDRIKGFPPGHRVVMNVNAVLRHGPRGQAAIEAYRKRERRKVEPIPPREVADGPVLEHVLTGSQVDVRQFPTPRWHKNDGGPYVGTECLVIQKDPISDWVNVGTYRVQVHDEKTLTVFIEPGKHGNIIRQRYWDQGQACPMIVCVGQAPVLGSVAGTRGAQYGESEFAQAGGMLGRPINVVRGEITGLPLPADAEIAFEGFVPPPEVETRLEGPFGEWPGYYGSAARPEPVLRVEAVYYRNDPIIIGSPPLKPTLPGRQGDGGVAGGIWDALEAAGVPGIKGVWRLAGGGSRLINVVAIEQMHPGHAKMAGLVAAGCGAGAYLGRLVVVVDDDIDITNPVEVFWAMATRWDPKTATDIIDGAWTGHIDPRLDPAKREVGDITNSRAIIYAVRPYHWRDQFPKVNRIDPAYGEEVRAKWAPKLAFLRR